LEANIDNEQFIEIQERGTAVQSSRFNVQRIPGFSELHGVIPILEP
jgi:hypothetical protein